MKNDQAHDAAESSFKKKERRLQEGKKAMAEHNAAMRADDAKTARLRALRLARDAAEAANPAKAVPVKAAKVSRAKKTAARAPVAAATATAASEPEGDQQQSPQMQEDHLKMVESDGARASMERTIPEPDQERD